MLNLLPIEIQQIVYKLLYNECILQIPGMFAYYNSEQIVSNECYYIEKHPNLFNEEYFFILLLKTDCDKAIHRYMNRKPAKHRKYCSCNVDQKKF